jgi:TM2 domain-containing membrane protein YozV
MAQSEEIERREEELRKAVSILPDDQRKEFYSRAEKLLKDPDTYATLNFFLPLGLHHFYLGKTVRGLVDMSVTLSGALLFLLGQPIGIALIVVILLIELPQLFKSQSIVAEYNNNVYEQLLR